MRWRNQYQSVTAMHWCFLSWALQLHLLDPTHAFLHYLCIRWVIESFWSWPRFTQFTDSLSFQWVRVWICESFSHDRDWLFCHLVDPCLNLQNFLKQKILSSSGSVFVYMNLSVLTVIRSSVVHRIGVWMSKSFGHNSDSLSLGQCLNPWIFWSWQWFTLLIFRGSVFEFLNLWVMTIIHSSHIEWVSVWSHGSFVHDRNLILSYSMSESANLLVLTKICSYVIQWVSIWILWHL